MNRTRLSKQLGVDEGRKRRIYRDTVGKWTVGVGRNIEDRGLRDDEIDLMLSNDIDEALGTARALLPNFDKLDEVRQEVVVNMAFNLGMTRLGGFRKFLAALNAFNYARAADEMESSMWFKQVGDRARRLVYAMREGKFQ
ncbi:glycoside hydrolase family protein [Pseudomonas sp. AO-1]|uniref:glycoside hydrolase family protein n=1 Tax=Pseudomonas sp. AO-1 TaxID=2855434 RepID=UPI001C796B16|nr:glycoside hydrolase family protein [Pseudomonas sp. AO-1]QXZ11674.1 glycoside hydrolase family protein [Pseudomonas sp. AO-1]